MLPHVSLYVADTKRSEKWERYSIMRQNNDVSLALLARRDVRIHDPSTIVRCGDFFYGFGTGPGIPFFRSRDLVNWERDRAWRVFPDLSARPAWWNDVVANFDGNCWAADIVQIDKKRYFLYYSVSTWGKNTSAIGLATNATLDPADRNHQWKDAGVVVRTNAQSDHNAIDPSATRDKRTGQFWLAYGSFWSGIKCVALDPKTGLRPAAEASAPPNALAWNQTIEAAYLTQHKDWWFLFVNWGLCCRGVNSTYEIRVGRSKKATGPFLDRDGKDLLKGGGSIFLTSDTKPGAFIGPGHTGIVENGRANLLSCHFYDGDKNGAPTLGIVPITWSKDNWPEVKR